MMDCHIAGELIEPLAAGEIALSDELRVHLDSCPHCAEQLTIAREIDQWLATGAVQVPPNFTVRVLNRLPSRSPEVQDVSEAWFHGWMALSLVLSTGGIWLFADPALLRQLVDGTSSAVSAVSGLLFEPLVVLLMCVALVVVTVLAVSNAGIEDF